MKHPLCYIRHDFDAVEHEEFEHFQDFEGGKIAIRYELVFPKRWECSRCGTVREPFRDVELVVGEEAVGPA